MLSLSSTKLEGVKSGQRRTVVVKATHWTETLPSTLPIAKPLLSEAVKHVTTRVCHFNGEVNVYSGSCLLRFDIPNRLCNTLKIVPGLLKLKI